MAGDDKTLESAGPVVELLNEAECLQLVSAGGVGRIGYTGRFGPTVLPVNYALYEGTIVSRTGQHSPLGEDLRTGLAGRRNCSYVSTRPASPAGAFAGQGRQRPDSPRCPHAVSPAMTSQTEVPDAWPLRLFTRCR